MKYPVANPPSIQLLRVAQYLPMSTEHQQYSTAKQSAAIALYAAAHKIGIVRSFADEGKAGPPPKGRRALQELLQTVQSAPPDYPVLWVTDSRRTAPFGETVSIGIE